MNALARTADGVLWIGTSRGVVSIGTDERVQRFGYTQETIATATTATALATKYVGEDQPDRAALLAKRIREDNQLESDDIAAGRAVEVFSAVPGQPFTRCGPRARTCWPAPNMACHTSRGSRTMKQRMALG